MENLYYTIIETDDYDLRIKTQIDPIIIDIFRKMLNHKAIIESELFLEEIYNNQSDYYFKKRKEPFRTYYIDTEILKKYEFKDEINFKAAMELLIENSGSIKMYIDDLFFDLYTLEYINKKNIKIVIKNEFLDIILGYGNPIKTDFYKEMHKLTTYKAERFFRNIVLRVLLNNNSEFTIKELKDLLKIPDCLYYHNFKKKYIFDPIKEIEKIINLNIEIEEIKENKTTKKVIFKLKSQV